MLSINEKISLRQLQALIIISAIGTGVIVLPRRAAEYAGSDGWMIVLGLTILAMIIGALVATAARLRPTNSFIESTGYFLTRPVAYFLGVVLWLKLVLAAGLELRAFLLVVQVVLLRHTPIAVTSLTMLAVAAYAAVKGIETRARMAEVLLALMIIPFGLLIVLAVMDIDWSNLQPVFTTPPETLLHGTLRLGFMFTGLECLLLASPYISPEKKMRRAVISALGFAGLIITVITVLTIAKFGQGVVDRPWPVLAMMDMLNLPGAFIERQEALMFSFWIITTFALLNALLFFGGVLIKSCLWPRHNTEHKHRPSRANRIWQIGVLITTVLVFAVSCIPWDEAAIYQRMDFMYLTLGLFFLVLLPIILIIVSKFRGKRALALITLAVLSLSSLSACWDKVEIENRAFVVAIGVDKTNENDDEGSFTVILSIPVANNGKDDEDEDENAPAHLKKASGQTIAEALKKIDAETDKQLHFGQAKLLVLGDALLENPEMVRSTLDNFNRHPELDRAMYVLAAHGKAAEILAIKPPGDTLPGLYIAAIYKDTHKLGGVSFTMDLEKLLTQLKYSESVLLPSVKAEKERLNLSGSVLLVDNSKIGRLTDDELQGYLWCQSGGGQGAILTSTVQDQPISFKVDKHRANIRFKEYGNNLQAHIKVELTGRIEECIDSEALLGRKQCREYAIRQLESAVRDEILQTTKKIQEEYAVDGYNWLEIMRKKQYSLYQRHASHWQDLFTKIDVIPQVTVKVS